MRKINTEIIVIGGGATGTGVARDLAMRGFQTLLVEKGDLTHGTTGRYHGLLHSGGRYVVKDPVAAAECIEENRILRRIMPHCIEDNGGFFVVTPWDDPSYAPRFVAGCQQAGIPVEEIPISQMLREEPSLNPEIVQCFRVPDAAADSFRAAHLNAESARMHGAQILRYHKVVQLIKTGNRVVGVSCQDLVANEIVEIHADLVVNASGAWAGQIAGLAGSQVQVIPGKGVMIAASRRIVNTIINRCKLPSDGDILVPIHTVTVIGTTDVKVDDPDHFAIEPWEIQLLLEEGDKIFPGFKELRMLRAWAGVRPLYQETTVKDTRDVTRAYILLDHATRDGLDGLVTITSGKWTTYRRMAEVTADLVCQKLGTWHPCRTHQEPLPEADEGHPYLGARLKRIENERFHDQIICECELATLKDVTDAIDQGQAQTIDDIRRDARLGMGPCQGGFCTYRVAGLLHFLRRPRDGDDNFVIQTNLSIRDFLYERWKGLLPILWGQQLRQERLNELIYLSLLNADHLPGPDSSPLTAELYLPAPQSTPPVTSSLLDRKPQVIPVIQGKTLDDIVVIGAGLAGLSAAWSAVLRGCRVRLVTNGRGSLYWQAGCIDVLGYKQLDGQEPVTSPLTEIEQLIHQNPDHPYALAGISTLSSSLRGLQDLCQAAGYPLHGTLEHNWLLPSALGVPRPTCLAPETMIAGDLSSHEPMLIINFAGFHDFYPDLIADNLSAQGMTALGRTVELPDLPKHSVLTGRVLAEAFDKPDLRKKFVQAIKDQAIEPLKGGVNRLGLPAVLGFDHALENKRYLEEALGVNVFEIPTLPASIPGIRIYNILARAIEISGGRIYEGLEITGSQASQAGHLALVWSEAAARRKPYHAHNFVLATGGLLGGGVKAHYDGVLEEVVCGLPIRPPLQQGEWFKRQFLGPMPHPIFTAGIQVNRHFQPVDADGSLIYNNLYCIGTALAQGDFLRERSLDGVGLATGYWIGTHL